MYVFVQEIASVSFHVQLLYQIGFLRVHWYSSARPHMVSTHITTLFFFVEGALCFHLFSSLPTTTTMCGVRGLIDKRNKNTERVYKRE